jgi:hypothetical protein
MSGNQLITEAMSRSMRALARELQSSSEEGAGMRKKGFLSLLAIGLSASTASATTIVLSGYVDDAGNPYLVGPGPSGSNSPSFVDDFEIANNTALHPITVPVAGLVSFTSLGFAAGGIDPYFTLFSGTGPGALFVDSNYDEAFSTGGDFSHTFALSAGDYTVAMGTFANMSFAENNPDADPTLGDGFTGLGGPSFLGFGNTYYYELEISTAASPVAEPSSFLIALASAAALGFRRGRGFQKRTKS